MAEKLITKSFERLYDKGKYRGFVTYEELESHLVKEIALMKILNVRL